MAIVLQAFSCAKERGAQTVLNPAPFQPLSDDLLQVTDTIILNETELTAALALPALPDATDIEALSRHLTALLARGPCMAIVTLGAYGVVVQGHERGPVQIAARIVAARDTTGAGDCFVGAYVAGCLEGLEAVAAVTFANAAAALSVTRDGAAASFPTRAEVDVFLSSAPA